MVKANISSLVFAAFTAISLACCGAADHGHEHGSAEGDDHADTQTVDPSKFGHLSAVYECGNKEKLQTSHTDAATTLTFRGEKVNVARKVSVVDNAFAGETFEGKFRGQNLLFKGKSHDASLTLNDDVISCQKITCIPLGGPH